jgi:hypothetical protein
VTGAAAVSSSCGGAFTLGDIMTGRAVSFAVPEIRSLRGSTPFDQADIILLFIRAHVNSDVHCENRSAAATALQYVAR